MGTKQTLILSLAAGLMGGIVSRYIAPEPVHAQARTPAPREIIAQSFALVDASGNRVGALTVSPIGRPAIALTYQGKTVFLDPLFAMEQNARRNVDPK
jgi:hypothetical protein